MNGVNFYDANFDFMQDTEWLPLPATKIHIIKQRKTEEHTLHDSANINTTST